jgi:hypothetical protein
MFLGKHNNNTITYIWYARSNDRIIIKNDGFFGMASGCMSYKYSKTISYSEHPNNTQYLHIRFCRLHKYNSSDCLSSKELEDHWINTHLLVTLGMGELAR